jgi:2-phosphosulfolactate phosphatase
MEIRHATLDTCAQATGLVVVIDVIRAFTTACIAFEAGAEEITLVSTVDDAFRAREAVPDALLMGEVGGIPPEGFDYGNSPSALAGLDLTGRRMIQRTSAGTQGVVRSTSAETLLAASFACAGATIRCIRSLNPAQVTLVQTDSRPGGYGDEDRACADYLDATLRDNQTDVQPYLERARGSKTARKIRDIEHPAFPKTDLDFCTGVDRVAFALRVERQNGWHVMKPVFV